MYKIFQSYDYYRFGMGDILFSHVVCRNVQNVDVKQR